MSVLFNNQQHQIKLAKEKKDRLLKSNTAHDPTMLIAQTTQRLFGICIIEINDKVIFDFCKNTQQLECTSAPPSFCSRLRHCSPVLVSIQIGESSILKQS